MALLAAAARHVGGVRGPPAAGEGRDHAGRYPEGEGAPGASRRDGTAGRSEAEASVRCGGGLRAAGPAALMGAVRGREGKRAGPCVTAGSAERVLGPPRNKAFSRSAPPLKLKGKRYGRRLLREGAARGKRACAVF